MSNVITLLSRLLSALFTAQPATTEPDELSLRDWADLPSHHPSA